MESFFLLTVGIFGIGALSSLILQNNGKLANLASNSFAILGSISGILLSGSILAAQAPVYLNLNTSFPLLNLSVAIDMISAFFVLVISTVALTSSIYGLDYMQKYAKNYNLGSFGFFYNLFIASLILVATASNGFYFLLVWELMSLTSYFLVIFENKVPENIRAGLLYLVMTHFGTAFILLAFLILFMFTGSFDFAVIKTQANNIPLMVKNAIFVLALIGFGTKAGIIPLHIWLPRAHPAAPSQVSALMSGVMIKVAVLMLMKLFLDMIPHGPIWWGVVILILGAVSSILGVLYALAEHDIKKLLAYHSVENIGIILMGLGSALTFYSLNLVPLAVLGIVAALYHTMNHAIFKSLLFLGAGSVVYQTHTHNIEEYGGLIKKMPYTAFFFLIGAVAISAIPPFNGFASEWMTYQSLFIGIAAQSTLVQMSFVLAIAALAVTGGLAAACFVKAFAITFLAKPRSQESEHATESPLSMNIGMGILTVLCLTLGIFATYITPQLILISQTLTGINSYPAILSVSNSIQVNQNFASLNLQAVLLALLGVFTFVMTIVYLITRSQKVEMVNVWDCGAPPLTTRAEITATGFSRALILMFGGILKPTKQYTVEYADVKTRYFPSLRTVDLEIPNLYETRLYRPLQTLIAFAASKISLIQNGNINSYLLYIFITLIGLLIWSSY